MNLLIKKNTYLNIFIILINLFILFFYFSNIEKDIKIDHSREITINKSIEAFNKNLPFFTSQKHIQSSVCNTLKGKYCNYKNSTNEEYIPTDYIWEDTGYFNFIYIIGNVKNFFSLDLVYQDLFILEYFFTSIVILILLFYTYNKSFFYFFLSPIFFFLFLYLNFRGNFHKDLSLMGYWCYPLLSLILFSFFIQIGQKYSNVNFFLKIILFFLAGNIFLIRGDTGYLFLLVYLFLYIIFFRKNYKIYKFFALIIIFFLPYYIFDMIKQNSYQKNINYSQKENYVSKHPVWISVWTGLGYVENSSFKISDESAMKAIDKKFGFTEYQSKDFENKIKLIIFEEIKKNPYILFSNIKEKFRDLLSQKHLYDYNVKNIYFISLIYCLILILLNRNYKIFLIFLYTSIILSIPSFIREPYMPYDSSFKCFIIFLPYIINLIIKKNEYYRN